MPRHSRKQMEIAQRRKLVAANLLAGATYREIAAQLNVSVGTIARDVKAVLRELHEHYTKDAEEWRNIQMRRTDVMLNSIWSQVRDGSLMHIDRALRLMDQQDKYLGIHDRLGIDQTLSIEWVDPLGDDDEIGVGAEDLRQ